jgi:methionyl-tRNA formyltransferase
MEIKINRIKYFANLPQHKGIVGAVVGVDDSGFFVKTKDSFIKVLEWSGYDRPRIGDRLG